MHPIIISALADGALALFQKFVNNPPAQVPENVGKTDNSSPSTWEEAFDQTVAYVERQSQFDVEQNEFIVKLAEQVDALSAKMADFEAEIVKNTEEIKTNRTEMDHLRTENRLLLQKAKDSAETAHQASQKFALALVFGAFGALISIACIVVLFLRK